MKITVFTSNQPRHIALIEKLAGIADEVYAVQEVGSVYKKLSPIKERYFEKVKEAERQIFGAERFLPSNVQTMAIRMGELSNVFNFVGAFESDYFITFGCSYVKEPLVSALIANKAVNVHMGLAPYYRGADCNFWAMHDGNPQHVGGTIHLLTKGLDSGPVLCDAKPHETHADPFMFTMKAVEATQDRLIELLNYYPIEHYTSPQDKSNLIRYSRYSDFTDEAVEEYMK